MAKKDSKNGGGWFGKLFGNSDPKPEALKKEDPFIGPDGPAEDAREEGVSNQEQKKSIIAEYFAYQDIDLPPEEKEKILQDTLDNKNAYKYAESLINLSSEKLSLDQIKQYAKSLVKKAQGYAEKANIPLSEFGKSLSWALWDIAKQQYYMDHPEEADENYFSASPFTKEKAEEIIDRHLGWEAYGAFAKGDSEWAKNVKTNSKFSDIRPLLNTEPKDNGTLHSYQLTDVGEFFRKTPVHEGGSEQTTTNTPEQRPETEDELKNPGTSQPEENTFRSRRFGGKRFPKTSPTENNSERASGATNDEPSPSKEGLKKETEISESSAEKKGAQAVAWLKKRGGNVAEGAKVVGKKTGEGAKVSVEVLKRINDVVDKLPPGTRLGVGIALMGTVMISGPAGWGLVAVGAKAFWTAASMEKISRKILSKKDSWRKADAAAQFTLAGIGLAFLLAHAFGAEDAIADIIPTEDALSSSEDAINPEETPINEPASRPFSPEDLIVDSGEAEVVPEGAEIAGATINDVLSVAENTPPPTVTGSDIGVTPPENSPVPVTNSETDINIDEIASEDVSAVVEETPPVAEPSAEEVAAQIGGVSATPEASVTSDIETETANTEGAPENETQAPSSPAEATLSIEVPVDIRVTARPGDGAITMLMQWAEAAQAQGGSFPEGSVMSQLVQAQNEGGLYEVAQRIAIEQGLYQPDAVNESFNVWEDATLATVQNPDGTFAFTLSNPGGEAHSLWSSASTETPVYTGSNMIDTTSSTSTEAPQDTSVAESRLFTQEDIQKRLDNGAWQSTETPNASGETFTINNPGAENTAAPEVSNEPSTEAVTVANETAERAFNLQGELVNLTEASWETLSSQPLPEIFLDQSATASERAQALMELAGENGIALDEEGAGQLENLISMMQNTEMNRTYGSVSLTENGVMRTLQDILIEGFRNRELAQ